MTDAISDGTESLLAGNHPPDRIPVRPRHDSDPANGPSCVVRPPGGGRTMTTSLPVSAWCRPCGMPPRPSGRCSMCGERLLPPGTLRIGDRVMLPADQIRPTPTRMEP